MTQLKCPPLSSIREVLVDLTSLHGQAYAHDLVNYLTGATGVIVTVVIGGLRLINLFSFGVLLAYLLYLPAQIFVTVMLPTLLKLFDAVVSLYWVSPNYVGNFIPNFLYKVKNYDKGR